MGVYRKDPIGAEGSFVKIVLRALAGSGDGRAGAIREVLGEARSARKGCRAFGRDKQEGTVSVTEETKNEKKNEKTTRRGKTGVRHRRVSACRDGRTGMSFPRSLGGKKKRNEREKKGKKKRK